MNNEAINVKNYFSSNGLHLSDEWLESCLVWCHEQNQAEPFTTQDLHKLVYEQWLSLDLRDVKVPILPPNLAQQTKTTLTETYYLQMMCVVDISKPKFSQLQKIRNNNSFRISDLEKEQINSNRLLQLTLTDGVQEIQAIELRPISSLHLNLTPGMKLQIVGPVIVRRGQILLEEKNLVVLEGEVEELIVQNAAENVMARALRLPENPNPNEIKENIDNTSVSTQNLSTYSAVQNKSLRSQTMNTNTLQNRQNSVNNLNLHLNKNVQRLQQSKTCDNSSVNNYGLSKEEEQQLAEEVEMLLNAEHSIQNETRNFSEFTSRNPNENKQNTSSLVGNKKEIENFNRSNKTTFEFDEDDDDDLFENMDIDAHLDLIDSRQEQQLPTEKIMQISELQFKKGNACKFTIKAKFKSVLEKLTIIDNKWRLKLLITDVTGDLVVLVHTDFMTKLAGLSPIEMKNMTIAGNSISEIQSKINKLVVDLKEKISTLDGNMLIEYKENEEVPFLIEIN